MVQAQALRGMELADLRSNRCAVLGLALRASMRCASATVHCSIATGPGTKHLHFKSRVDVHSLC